VEGLDDEERRHGAAAQRRRASEVSRITVRSHAQRTAGTRACPITLAHRRAF
jgi:hypothetical protein